jgi:hypothetical protein
MVTHMKTTIEISDALLSEAKRLAAREGITVRTLVEQGLRHAIRERRAHAKFQLRKATFHGDGLNPDIAGLEWDRIRELAYEGRGG